MAVFLFAEIKEFVSCYSAFCIVIWEVIFDGVWREIMQFKRDTDFAVRIMIGLAERLYGSDRREEVSAVEIFTACGIPLVTFRRICEALADNKLIQTRTNEKGEVQILPVGNIRERSLLVIAEAIEGTVDVFSVFEPKSNLMSRYGGCFSVLEDKVKDELGQLTIGVMLESKEHGEPC